MALLDASQMSDGIPRINSDLFSRRPVSIFAINKRSYVHTPWEADVVQRTYAWETFSSPSVPPQDSGSVAVFDGSKRSGLSSHPYPLITVHSRRLIDAFPHAERPATHGRPYTCIVHTSFAQACGSPCSCSVFNVARHACCALGVRTSRTV